MELQEAKIIILKKIREIDRDLIKLKSSVESTATIPGDSVLEQFGKPSFVKSYEDEIRLKLLKQLDRDKEILKLYQLRVSLIEIYNNPAVVNSFLEFSDKISKIILKIMEE